MKKIIFFLIGSVLIVSLLYIKFTQKTVIVKELSPRAKEYIAERKKLQDETWVDVNFNEQIAGVSDKKTVPKEKEIKEDCFIVDFKYPVELMRRNGGYPCNLYIKVANPNVRVIITHRTFSSNLLEDVPDIRLRKTQKEEYEESKKIVQNKEWLVFQKRGNGFEKTAFTFYNNHLVSITISSHYAQEFDYMLDEVLSGFTYLL